MVVRRKVYDERVTASGSPFTMGIYNYIYICRGVGWGGVGRSGKQVGSMDEEPQVRGCYNITFICTPTNQEIVSVGKDTRKQNI